LSPTPPVECLSTRGRPTLERSSRSPDATIAAVHVDSSRASRPRKKIAMSKADACSSATSPDVYARTNHPIWSSLRTPPSRFVRITSMTSTAVARLRQIFGTERGGQ
jgi:hypothetical protein